jgi:signal transduction histidine kinase
MHVYAPRRSPAAASSFSATHRRIRRIRWFWLLGALILYACTNSADQFIMEHFQVVLDARLVDWSVAALIGVSFTLAIGSWEDRYLAHIEALEDDRAAAEQAIVQLDAARATARTVAHTLNQPLAIIGGTAELYRDTPPTERRDADLALILGQVDRAAGLVHELLEISQYRTIPYPGGAPMLDLHPPPESV